MARFMIFNIINYIGCEMRYVNFYCFGGFGGGVGGNDNSSTGSGGNGLLLGIRKDTLPEYKKLLFSESGILQ